MVAHSLLLLGLRKTPSFNSPHQQCGWAICSVPMSGYDYRMIESLAPKNYKCAAKAGRIGHGRVRNAACVVRSATQGKIALVKKSHKQNPNIVCQVASNWAV
jgi:hypothetical protein